MYTYIYIYTHVCILTSRISQVVRRFGLRLLHAWSRVTSPETWPMVKQPSELTSLHGNQAKHPKPRNLELYTLIECSVMLCLVHCQPQLLLLLVFPCLQIQQCSWTWEPGWCWVGEWRSWWCERARHKDGDEDNYDEMMTILWLLPCLLGLRLLLDLLLLCMTG